MDNFQQTEKLWNEIVETMNKLSYIAAGTISLSITFLGYILNNNSSIKSILTLPVVYNISTINILFLSWIILFFCVFLGIVVRIPNAWYLFDAHVNLWFEDLAERTMSNNSKNYKFVADYAKNRRDKYKKISSFIIWPTIIFFALGILMLIIFTIIVVNGLIIIK